MIKQTLRNLALSFSVFTAVATVHAQTPEQLHSQNHDAHPDVQAHGIPTTSQDSFIDTYAPPKDITTVGSRVDWLFRYTSWVTFFFFVLMAGSLLYYLLFFRARPGHRAYYTHGGSSSNKIVTKFLDLAVFLSLDLVVWVSSFNSSRDVVWAYPTGPDVVKVQVMPQQWAWNFRYAGADGQFGTVDDIVTINELRVPKGRKVMLELKSKDVIHGFWAPNLRRQVDALPGAITRFWFDTTETGDFEIACAHLCGTAHYKMKAFLKVVDEADYNDWVQERSAWAAAQFDPEDKATQWGWNWGI